MQYGWLYLTAVLDWYSRYILSWALSQILKLDFALTAVDNTLFQAAPEIWNSDQGSHFASPRYLECLQNENIKISMDDRGRARDNIFTERLWRTIKYEEVYLHEYASPKVAYRQLADYIHFYNFERSHQALDYLKPAQVYGLGKVKMQYRNTCYWILDMPSCPSKTEKIAVIFPVFCHRR